jgi:hypothetical protein
MYCWMQATSRNQQDHHVRLVLNIAPLSASSSSAGLWDSVRTFPTSNPTQRFIIDQALELEEYHSNRQSDLGTLLPSSPTSTRDKRVVTIMLWDTSSNQISHIHNNIYFSVNTYVLLYF